MTSLQKLKNKLSKVEQELNKNRTSVLQDGWQTQKYAKKSRKWDVLAQEKIKLISLIDDLEICNREKHNDDIFNYGNCLECDLNIKK